MAVRSVDDTMARAYVDVWPCDLGTAIVHRACVDYLMLLRGKTHNSHGGIGNLDEIELFFRSPWFHFLCGADGEAILAALRRKNSKGVKTIHYKTYSNQEDT